MQIGFHSSKQRVCGVQWKTVESIEAIVVIWNRVMRAKLRYEYYYECVYVSERMCGVVCERIWI